MADRHDFVLEAMRSSNPRPAGTAGPSDEWTTQELFSAIEAGRSEMDTIKERTQTVQPQRPNRRGWRVAAAAFVAVLLVGATVLALRPAPSSDVVEPLPTTTVSPPTTATSTTIAATTTTEVPTTTLPPRVPQTFEASVVWDGESCTLDGPGEIHVRDTLEITYTNASADVVDFMVVYLTSGYTPSDLVPYNGDIDVTDPGARRAPFAMLVDTAPGSSGFGTLQVGTSHAKTLTVKTPREHVVICLGGPQPPAAASQLAVSSATGIAVTN